MRNLNRNIPCYVFGTGSFGQQTVQALLSQDIQVRAFVSNTDQRDTLDGLPILKWSQIPKDEPSQILLAVFNREHALDQFYREAKQHLVGDIIMPWDFYGQISKQLGWQYWLQDAEQMNRHRPILDEAINLMEDEQSKVCLQRVFNFRYGADIEYASFQHDDDQYFNEITMRGRDTVSCYIDIGAFDGANLSELEALVDVECAFLFEPEKSNYSQILAAKNSFQTKKLFILPVAVSNDTKVLSFDGDQGESSKICEDGQEHVISSSLDKIIPAHLQVDFVKMDVEGAELDVLAGGQKLLARCRPTLAISLYHNWDDLWKIPQALDSTLVSYAYYVRQHMRNSFDLVLYAVPRS